MSQTTSSMSFSSQSVRSQTVAAVAFLSRSESERAAPVISRRALFTGFRHRQVAKHAANLGVMSVLAGGALSARVEAAPPEVSGDVDPGSVLVKLTKRITMGATLAELALANSFGYQGYLDYQLNAAAIPEDPTLVTRLEALTSLTMTPQQMLALTASQVSNELIEAAIVRGVWSKRQLLERMVECWTDHFNIDIRNESDQYLKTVDDRGVVRPNALGKFPDLLRASAHSPAMLYYLGNNLNRVGKPNENYARELMELHSLGVDGGYTQQDVQEIARCFTGWGLYGLSASDPNSGLFRYRSSDHDNGPKLVLGQTIAAGGGMQDGETVLNILLAHPSTPKFIARKICRTLLSEAPSQSVIDSVAATYTATGGDIKAMIRTALAPNVLADAPPKYKRPFHVFVSALRALPTAITSTSTLRSRLNAAGHVPFYWSTPDGYPDTLNYWVGLVIARWNFGAALMANQISGVTVNGASFFTGITTAAQTVDKLNAAIFLGEMPAVDQARVKAYLLPDNPSATKKNEAIGLAIGSPSFQWY